MTTVLIGGSRHISRLSDAARKRLNNVVAKGFPIVVGDAAGADKAVQKFLLDAGCRAVTVYDTGERCRNNLGDWPVRRVAPAGDGKGFAFHAAKDRAMACVADAGLMIWDGKSPGTALNVLRLLRAGKQAVLLDVPGGRTLTFAASADWDGFLSAISPTLRDDLRKWATPGEWQGPEWDGSEPPRQGSLFDQPPARSDEELAATLAAGDPASVDDA